MPRRYNIRKRAMSLNGLKASRKQSLNEHPFPGREKFAQGYKFNPSQSGFKTTYQQFHKSHRRESQGSMRLDWNSNRGSPNRGWSGRSPRDSPANRSSRPVDRNSNSPGDQSWASARRSQEQSSATPQTSSQTQSFQPKHKNGGWKSNSPADQSWASARRSQELSSATPQTSSLTKSFQQFSEKYKNGGCKSNRPADQSWASARRSQELSSETPLTSQQAENKEGLKKNGNTHLVQKTPLASTVSIKNGYTVTSQKTPSTTITNGNTTAQKGIASKSAQSSPANMPQANNFYKQDKKVQEQTISVHQPSNSNGLTFAQQYASIIQLTTQKTEKTKKIHSEQQTPTNEVISINQPSNSKGIIYAQPISSVMQQTPHKISKKISPEQQTPTNEVIISINQPSNSKAVISAQQNSSIMEQTPLKTEKTNNIRSEQQTPTNEGTISGQQYSCLSMLLPQATEWNPPSNKKGNHLKKKKKTQSDQVMSEGDIASLHDLMRCYRCRQWLVPEHMFSCICSLACIECISVVPQCPGCKSVMSINPNLSTFYQRISNVIPHPCPNRGCSEIVNPKEGHEATCKYRPLECPLCGLRIPKTSVWTHFQEIHSKQTPLREGENNLVLESRFWFNRESEKQIIYCFLREQIWTITLNKFEVEQENAQFIIEKPDTDPNLNFTVKMTFTQKWYTFFRQAICKPSNDLSIVEIPLGLVREWLNGDTTLDVLITVRQKRKLNKTNDSPKKKKTDKKSK